VLSSVLSWWHNVSVYKAGTTTDFGRHIQLCWPDWPLGGLCLVTSTCQLWGIARDKSVTPREHHGRPPFHSLSQARGGRAAGALRGHTRAVTLFCSPLSHATAESPPVSPQSPLWNYEKSANIIKFLRDYSCREPDRLNYPMQKTALRASGWGPQGGRLMPHHFKGAQPRCAELQRHLLGRGGCHRQPNVSTLVSTTGPLVI